MSPSQLRRALELWRASGDETAGDAVVALGAALARSEPAIAPPTSTVEASAWHRALHARGELAVERLLESLVTESHKVETARAFEALIALAPDVRVQRWLHDWLGPNDRDYQGRRRDGARILAVQTARRALAHHTPEESARRPLTDQEAAELSAAVAALPADPIVALKATAAETRDGDARQVVADVLAEHGDPLGEFINLQAQRGLAPPTTRENKLLKAYAAEWLGPLRVALGAHPELVRFRNGSPHTLAIERGHASVLLALRAEACASLLEVHLVGQTFAFESADRMADQEIVWLRTLPRVRKVQRVAYRQVAQIADGNPFPWTHCGVLGGVAPDLKRALKKLPELEHLTVHRSYRVHWDGTDTVDLLHAIILETPRLSSLSLGFDYHLNDRARIQPITASLLRVPQLRAITWELAPLCAEGLAPCLTLTPGGTAMLDTHAPSRCELAGTSYKPQKSVSRQTGADCKTYAAHSLQVIGPDVLDLLRLAGATTLTVRQPPKSPLKLDALRTLLDQAGIAMAVTERDPHPLVVGGAWES